MLKLKTMRRSLRAELRVSRDKRVSDFGRSNKGSHSGQARGALCRAIPKAFDWIKMLKVSISNADYQFHWMECLQGKSCSTCEKVTETYENSSLMYTHQISCSAMETEVLLVFLAE